jgi:ferredoxin
MNVLLVYFSATGNTARIASAIQDTLCELGADVDVKDITAYPARRQSLDVDAHDAVIFGFPVHALQAPRLVREYLIAQQGHGKKCATFFTYGGFRIHPAHHTTHRLLKAAGFHPVSSAEFLAAHSFNHGGWRALPDRPNQDDLDVARRFARRTLQRFSGDDDGRVEDLDTAGLDQPTLDLFEHGRFKTIPEPPSRRGADCSMCMACEDLCPSQAMDAVEGRSDPQRCILCLRCMAVCPDQALKINDLSASWAAKLEQERETSDSLKRKKSRIYL